MVMRPWTLLFLAFSLVPSLYADVHFDVGDSTAANPFPLDPHETRTYVVTASSWSGEFNSNVRVDIVPFGGTTVESLATTRGTCDNNGCSIGDLHSLESATITAVVRAGEFASGTHQGFVVRSPSAPIPFTKSFAVYRHIEVTSAADDGAGSLRRAIAEANTTCADDECKIVFSGPLTIAPRSPLPTIAARRITIDGASQTELTGAAAGSDANGLRLAAGCVSRVLGMNVHDFALYALDYVTGDRSDCGVIRQTIEGNTLTHNLRGIRADNVSGLVQGNVISDNRRSGIWKWSGEGEVLNIVDNRIEHNGASGIFVGPGTPEVDVRQNTIADNVEMGVAIWPTAGKTLVDGNVFRGNGGEAIDRGLDGPNGIVAGHVPNPPQLDAAHYEAATDTTIVEFTIYRYWNVDRSIAYDEDRIVFYANGDPRNQGEQIAGKAAVRVDVQPQSFRATLKGDFRGKWLTATSTLFIDIAARGDQTQSTSEFSNAVFVP